MQCGQNVQLLNVQLLVHHVTSRLLKVKGKILFNNNYLSNIAFYIRTNKIPLQYKFLI